MLGIRAAFRKIYSGPDVVFKHLVLCFVGGIGTIFAVQYEAFKHGGQVIGNGLLYLMILGFCVLFFVMPWIVGYMLELCHNSFDDRKSHILPELSFSYIGDFYRALPLFFCWGFLYPLIMILSLAVITGMLLPKTIAVFVCVPIILIYTISPMFIYIRYSKDYDTSDLYNPMLPFKFVLPTIINVILLSFNLSIIAFLVFLGVGLITRFHLPENVMYVVTGYLSTIFYFVFAFCLVQIYREKLVYIE